jgi:hypothetical protein
MRLRKIFVLYSEGLQGFISVYGVIIFNLLQVVKEVTGGRGLPVRAGASGPSRCRCNVFFFKKKCR